MVDDGLVPSTPASVLQRFEAFAPRITPRAVLTAMKREALPLDKPLIRFQGRAAPEGGKDALRETWRQAMRGKIVREAASGISQFAYTGFGTPGTVVSDTRDPELGIREIRFANGVMLNVKHTQIEKGTVRVRLAIDGGGMLDTRSEERRGGKEGVSTSG